VDKFPALQCNDISIPPPHPPLRGTLPKYDIGLFHATVENSGRIWRGKKEKRPEGYEHQTSIKYVSKDLA
jgi:hypothetical protein